MTKPEASGGSRVLFEALSPRGEPWLWTACALLGLACAVPYLLCRYLPLTDLPLHQLSFAVWVEPERFAAYYERQTYWLPYWTAMFVARPFVGVLGVEAASRMPVFLYVAALPLTSAMLARAAGRSGYWGLLLAAFALEFNLAWGFVSYCLAGVFLQLVLVCALRAEGAKALRPVLALEALAATVLGFTHPQTAVIAVAACVLVSLLSPDRGAATRARRAGVVLASLPALVPSIVYFADGKRAAAFQAAKGLTFASLGAAIENLPRFSIDALDGPVEEVLFACVVGLVALSWRAVPRPSVGAMRLALLALGFLVAYFVTPFDWNGQAVCQRMPFLVLLCLPGLAAPGRAPAGLLRGAFVAIGVIGAGNAAMTLSAFDRETRAELDPLLASAPPNQKTIYLAYDTSWPGIHSEPYLHTGAYLTLRGGGAYAFNFNRLNTRYRDDVPLDQLMIGQEFALSRRFRKGERVTLSRKRVAFWDAALVRFGRDDEPIVPVAATTEELAGFRQGRRFGLLPLLHPVEQSPR